MRQINRFVIHCSATRPEWMASAGLDAQVAEIRRWHQSPPKNWLDIGYHWIIGRKGEVARGRSETMQGAHVAGHNHDSIGFCLIGGHGSDAQDAPEEHFTAPQLRALRRLLSQRLTAYPGATIHGHNEFAARACPGFDARKWWANPPAEKACPICGREIGD